MYMKQLDPKYCWQLFLKLEATVLLEGLIKRVNSYKDDRGGV